MEDNQVKNKFYYTFGSDSLFPFQNGWVEIEAANLEAAHKIFIKHFPCRHENVLNCAFFYTEKEWEQLNPEKNWRGYQCYEKIKK